MNLTEKFYFFGFRGIFVSLILSGGMQLPTSAEADTVAYWQMDELSGTLIEDTVGSNDLTGTVVESDPQQAYFAVFTGRSV